jgi:DNA adenine methylase
MAWPGGKDGAGVAQRLINQIPPHDVFVSAFLGDCAILRRKLPAKRSVGIDLDRANIERWLLNSPVPNLSLYCCCGIEWLRHAFSLYLVEPPNPAASAERRTSPRKKASPDPDGGTVRTFVYLDPPYLLSSRQSRKAIYKHELSDDQHAELLAVALRLPCQVMISHYPHQLYDDCLRGWRTFTFSSITRGGKKAIEKVWCNYDEPGELHDARFVGGNKRERERVRRRVRNWVDGLGRMQPAERQAILDAIEGRYFQRPRALD